MGTSSALTIYNTFQDSVGSFITSTLGTTFLIVAGLVGLGFAWRHFTKLTGAMPIASVMTREQRNSRYEKFFNRRLERGL